MKSIGLVICIFCFKVCAFAQESEIVYPRPFRFEKINGVLMADARILYNSEAKGLTVELDGKLLRYVISGDSLKVKLPLIGDEKTLEFRKNGRLIRQQLFYPYIPADWNYFKNGTIDIVNTSHQDIAWMNTPDSCREERIHKIIMPAFEMAKKNPEFSFGMEQTLNLRELLDEYPDYKKIVKEAYQKNQFAWGATFNQPYEGLLSDEQMVRGLYLGRKWIRDQFNGEVDSRTAFDMDVPGRSDQFPQILSKAGVKYLVVSRMKEGFFNWYSPDGSRVLTYSPGNYGWASMIYKYFDQDAPEAMHRLHKVLKNWNNYYASKKIPPHYAVMISNDAAGPIFYKEVIHEWNRIAAESGFQIPTLRYKTAESFLTEVDSPEARFDSISGERPNLWLYIHGPAHYEAINAKKKAAIHLPAAEMFTTLNCLIKDDFSSYPRKVLDSAWYQSIYDDHGWGGKHGDITDSIFNSKLHDADAMATQQLATSLQSISAQIELPAKNAIVVFNDLARERSGMAEVVLPSGTSDYGLTDAGGKRVLSQRILKEGKNLLRFVADAVPSVGYSTYYLSTKDPLKGVTHKAMSNSCDNKFYKIALGNGGIKSLYDKELGKDMLNTTRFSGGDVMDLGYDGNGAGEFTEITPTNMTGFDKLSSHSANWKITEDGSLYTVFQAAYAINNVKIIQRITVYHEIKKIAFEYEIPDWKGVKNRQLRFALPMNAENASVSYDVPMGVSTVGVSELSMRPGGWAWGGTYSQKPEEIHPREVQNFVSANANDFGLTLSSHISVFDWIDPTVDAVHYPVIQAIMLSTHKSCHGEGNWYLQKGAHTFRFAITSHKSGWKNGFDFGTGDTHDFYTVFKKEEQKTGNLPATLSFIKSTTPFVKISAFKKSDEGNQGILRLINMSGLSENVPIRFFKNIDNFNKVSLIEEDQGTEVSLTGNVLHAELKQYSIESYRIRFDQSTNSNTLK